MAKGDGHKYFLKIYLTQQTITQVNLKNIADKMREDKHSFDSTLDVPVQYIGGLFTPIHNLRIQSLCQSFLSHLNKKFQIAGPFPELNNWNKEKIKYLKVWNKKDELFNTLSIRETFWKFLLLQTTEIGNIDRPSSPSIASPKFVN